MRLNEFALALTESLAVGDPVIITGNVEYEGKTGDVREIGRDGAFVVVDLYNYGPQSFQASDVSRNDYADGDDDEDLAEVSKATLDRYVTKASDAHGDADFAARMSKNDPDKRSYHVDQKKTAEKRRQGISRALDRMSRQDDVAEGPTTEAFGRGKVSPLDKQLKKEIPKNPAEIVGDTLAVIGSVGSAVAGLIQGISFVSPQADWATAGYILSGGLGAILGGALGMAPGALIAGSSKSFQKRQKIKSDQLAQFIQKNSELPADLEKFVTNLISQTPESIIKMSNYITHLTFDAIEVGDGKGVSSYYSSITGDETEQRIKELIKLISSYFLQQEKLWERIASKYNVHPDTLYQIYNSINKQDIERQWLDGIKNKITAPQQGVAEQERVGNMDADRFDAAMARLKKLAGAGPLKTVYDPAKRVYRNVPTAVQPQTQPKK